ncbi:DNA-3-methyladenine glycosylase 2 family protein [Candidatus Saccharibacteria bacterium]|nr:DNA-3-methyladenine glycosylase 2 family protein [Candidatus Saccharibacteria bacterium]
MNLTADEAALCQLDENMDKLIRANGTIQHERGTVYFTELAESIISQQLSVKASDTIFRRFKEVTNLAPEKAAVLTEAETMRIGLSGQKARYIRDLAEHFVQDSAVFDHLDSLSDDEVIAELTQVKGIGVWTAQMFLMFTLGRPDVFAPDDLGLLNALVKLYDLPERPKRADAIELAEKWKPYRTTACFHLWHMLDNKPL